MKTKLFGQKYLQNILWESGKDENGIKVAKLMSDEIYDTSRWSQLHELVFQDLETEKFYRVCYSKGLTEYQEEDPFQFQENGAECVEVEQVEKVVLVWEEVK